MLQELLLIFIGLWFLIGLLPAVFKHYKIKSNVFNFSMKTTQVLTAIGMLVLSLTFLSMGLIYPGIISMLTAMLWSIISIPPLNFKRTQKSLKRLIINLSNRK